jgi:hypothetical protein
MSDHLIAEANRHAMTLPTTHPTHADIAWYVREVDQLRDELAAARQRETIAIASWDEERNRALREGERVVEWRDRAERAEAALRALVGKVASTICDCEGAVAYIFEREPGDKYRVQVALDRAWQVCATIPIKKASK